LTPEEVESLIVVTSQVGLEVEQEEVKTAIAAKEKAEAKARADVAKEEGEIAAREHCGRVSDLEVKEVARAVRCPKVNYHFLQPFWTPSRNYSCGKKHYSSIIFAVQTDAVECAISR
jgi:hypothetical protein